MKRSICFQFQYWRWYYRSLWYIFVSSGTLLALVLYLDNICKTDLCAISWISKTLLGGSWSREQLYWRWSGIYTGLLEGCQAHGWASTSMALFSCMLKGSFTSTWSFLPWCYYSAHCYYWLLQSAGTTQQHVAFNNWDPVVRLDDACTADKFLVYSYGFSWWPQCRCEEKLMMFSLVFVKCLTWLECSLVS